MERGTRFELVSPAWKAGAQPICQPRSFVVLTVAPPGTIYGVQPVLVGEERIELPTFSV